MKKRYIALPVTVITLCFSPVNYAGFFEQFNSVVDQASKVGGDEITQSALSNSEVVDGLKEALASGVESAIMTLGKPGGFVGNSLVEIAVPDSLETVATTARTLGQGQYVDELEMTMNVAAEKAVPEAAGILGDAIRQMSVEDAMNILNGPDDAATQYFRKVSEASLAERFKPIVAQATNQAGVTAAYKNLTGQATPLLSGVLGNNALDLDQYITDQSLDGLFKYIAIEEKNIRTDPSARSTDLLKQVFGN